MTRGNPDNTLARMVRQAIKRSGMTRFELSRRSGVPYAAVHGFVSGERDATLTTASRLLEALGLHVVLAPKRRKRG